jgi:hypothetical protein
MRLKQNRRLRIENILIILRKKKANFDSGMKRMLDIKSKRMRWTGIRRKEK